MSQMLLDRAAREVLGRYAVALRGSTLRALGNAGGFSGARLWQVDGPTGAFCLRAWPPGGLDPWRLQTIHQLMAVASDAGLAWVPAVWPTSSGERWVETAGRLWDLTTWMPGRADYHVQPTRARLQAAVTALAHLHRAWAGVRAATGPCPAVRRRLAGVRRWTGLLDSGWSPLPVASADDPVRPWAERAWPLLRDRIEKVPHQLAPWVDRQLPLQPCLCDVWHDHLLFTGDTLTGLVDFGGVKLDHVAVDLARLLGSLAEDDAEGWAAGLQAYSRMCRLTADDERLIAVLDETGTLLGTANWLIWLYHEGRTFEDRAAVAGRLGRLVRRIGRE
jgi:homoserine kinase type II